MWDKTYAPSMACQILCYAARRMMEAKVALAAFVPLRIRVGSLCSRKRCSRLRRVAGAAAADPPSGIGAKGERGLSALSSVAAHVLCACPALQRGDVYGADRLRAAAASFWGCLAGRRRDFCFRASFRSGAFGAAAFSTVRRCCCVLGLCRCRLLPSGRVLGLDSVLHSRLPSWLR